MRRCLRYLWCLLSVCVLCIPVDAEAQLIISEFRLRGPGGVNDEFVEIYNNSGADHTVAGGGTGYALAASNGVARCVIPNGTIIPRGGHYLCVNSVEYGLASYPAGNGTTATGDATYTTDIPDNAGLALFNTSVAANFVFANRLDAAGSTSEANSLYKEGTGYPALQGSLDINSSFVRKRPGGCTGSFSGNCNSVSLMQTTSGPQTNALQDTNSNFADFIFIDTAGTSAGAGAGQRLGAPGPENLSSPPVSSDGLTLTGSLIDSSKPYNAPPNYVRSGGAYCGPPNPVVAPCSPGLNSTFGTMDIRQRFTNNTGGNITRLRFRVIDITTFPSIGGVADLRPITSSDTSASGATVRGTTLEQPPSQPYGSGFNGTLSVNAITLAAPLTNGSSVNVRFMLGVQQLGAARFCVAAEMLPFGSSQVFCFIGPTEGVLRERAVRTFENAAAIVIPASGTGDALGAPANPYPSTITVSGITGPVTRITVTLKQISHTFPEDIDVLLVGPTGVKFILMSDVLAGTDFTGQTYTFDDRAASLLPNIGTPPASGSFKPTNYENPDGFPEPAPAGAYLSGGTAGTDSLTSAFGGLNPNGTWRLYVVDDHSIDVGTFAGGWDLTIISSCTAPLAPVAADFNGDCVSDTAVYRPTTGNWLVPGQAPVQFGLPGDIPVAGDYDGNGTIDRAVFRPSSGFWFVHNQATVQFGLPGDIPVPFDYNADGTTDRAVFRPSNGGWYVHNIAIVQWGLPGDMPVPGDYTGDRLIDPAVFRPSTGTWFVQGQSPVQWGLLGDIPVPADYNGGGVMDLAVYRPSTGTWFVQGMSPVQWGLPGDIPVPGDFDGDHEADLVVYRPANGTWYVKLSTTNYMTSISGPFGAIGDIPIPDYVLALRSTLTTLSRVSDVDGDRVSDLTVYRPSNSTWFTRRSSSDFTTSTSVQWGLSGDLPMPHDYDGDGQTDVAVYRPSNGNWIFLRSSSGFTTSTAIPWGLSTDTPVPGDYDGDRVSDPAVYRPSTGTWHVLLSGAGYTTTLNLQWGSPGDVPILGDFDGDAMSDLTVYRPSDGTWWTRFSSTGYMSSTSYQWGLPGDVSVPGDYDGDGKTDRAVYRPSSGFWYVLHSSSNQTTSSSHQWGLNTDNPVPGDFDGDRKTDFAVWRPSNGTWYLLLSSSNYSVFDQIQWGLSSDIPILKRP